MAYRLRTDEQVQDGLRRSAREQLERAADALKTRADDDPVTAVHDARKAVKKARSVLRLGRGAMDSDERRRVNASLRAAAGALSSARDAEVMIEAVDELADRFAGQVPKKTFDDIRRHLEAERDPARQRLLESGLTHEVAGELQSVTSGIDDWPMQGKGWKAIKPGLLRGYATGRELFATAREDPTVANLHEWRKRVKDLWYALRILKPLAPGIVGGHADEAHQLADLLGDDHDLGVLRETLQSSSGALAVDLDAVTDLIDHRRRELEMEAFEVGARVYAEPPKAFVRRIHQYWRASRGTARRQAASLAKT